MQNYIETKTEIILDTGISLVVRFSRIRPAVLEHTPKLEMLGMQETNNSHSRHPYSHPNSHSHQKQCSHSHSPKITTVSCRPSTNWFLTCHKAQFWACCSSYFTLLNRSTSSLLRDSKVTHVQMILEFTSVHLLNLRQLQRDSSCSMLNKSMCRRAAIS